MHFLKNKGAHSTYQNKQPINIIKTSRSESILLSRINEISKISEAKRHRLLAAYVRMLHKGLTQSSSSRLQKLIGQHKQQL